MQIQSGVEVLSKPVLEIRPIWSVINYKYKFFSFWEKAIIIYKNQVDSQKSRMSCQLAFILNAITINRGECGLIRTHGFKHNIQDCKGSTEKMTYNQRWSTPIFHDCKLPLKRVPQHLPKKGTLSFQNFKTD